MKSFTYTIKDEIGIHARPASLLAKKARNYSSKCFLEVDGKSVELTRLLALMSLGVTSGALIKVTADGMDENTAIEDFETFFRQNL